MKAPYIPEVSSPTDTSNFDDLEVSGFSTCDTQPPNVTAAFAGHHLPFIGFTYTHGSQMSDCFNLIQDLVSYGHEKASSTREVLIEQLQRQNGELQRQISNAFSEINSNNNAASQETLIAQLKDEIQILRRRLDDEAATIQRPAKEANIVEMESRIKELKEKNRQLILEKQELQTVSYLTQYDMWSFKN